MDEVILAHKPKQLRVVAQLMEALPPCSLGLGYRCHIGIHTVDIVVCANPSSSWL